MGHFGGPLYMINICRINGILYQLIFRIFETIFWNFLETIF